MVRLCFVTAAMTQQMSPRLPVQLTTQSKGIVYAVLQYGTAGCQASRNVTLQVASVQVGHTPLIHSLKHAS